MLYFVNLTLEICLVFVETIRVTITRTIHLVYSLDARNHQHLKLIEDFLEALGQRAQIEEKKVIDEVARDRLRLRFCRLAL